jgi:hypothetical protein
MGGSWAPEPVWCFEKQKDISAMLEIEPGFSVFQFVMQSCV